MNDLSIIEAEFGDLAPYREGPDFWLSHPDKGGAFIGSLKEAIVRPIGRSAGGRELVAIEYGEKEPLDATTDNLISALASGQPADFTQLAPAAFYGTTRREKPGVVLQGALHGGELTGTVASLNLCAVIETGADLRGKAWPNLRELARGTRLCIVPWLNIDGAVRWPLHNPANVSLALYQRCTQGVALDGTKYQYPKSKGVFPIPPDGTAFMGSYYNDAGANLQYDAFTLRRQPETEAWMTYYLQERPDGVVMWHCNAGTMILSSAPTPRLRAEVSRMAGAVRQRLVREGYAVTRLSVEGGTSEGAFNQGDAVYYTCGATPVTCELPAGLDIQPYTCDEMLDIGLITIEEILFYAHHDGLRGGEYWDKVKRLLQFGRSPNQNRA